MCLSVVGVIQVTSLKDVILFQTCNITLFRYRQGPFSLLSYKEIPRHLHELLVDVGVNITEKVRRIKEEFSVNVRGWLDLRHFYKKDWFFPKFCHHLVHFQNVPYSYTRKSKKQCKRFIPELDLAALVKFGLNKKHEKPKMFSGWERTILKNDQINNAACDAAASLDVFFSFVFMDMGRDSLLNDCIHFFMIWDYVEEPFNKVTEKPHILEKLWKHAHLDDKNCPFKSIESQPSPIDHQQKKRRRRQKMINTLDKPNLVKNAIYWELLPGFISDLLYSLFFFMIVLFSQIPMG